MRPEAGAGTGFRAFIYFIGFEADVLILETPPQTLDPYVVQLAVTAMHGYLYRVFKDEFRISPRYPVPSIAAAMPQARPSP